MKIAALKALSEKFPDIRRFVVAGLPCAALSLFLATVIIAAALPLAGDSYAQSITTIERYSGIYAERWKAYVDTRYAENPPVRIEPSSETPAQESTPGRDSELVFPGSQSTRKAQEEMPSIVYTRVPRTTGASEVVLRDGEKLTLRSPDIWDRLPDTRHVFEGFNAPGQLVLRASDGQETIIFDCVTTAMPCVPLDVSVSPGGDEILFSVYRGKRIKAARWDGVSLPNQRLSGAMEAQLYRYRVTEKSLVALPHNPGDFDVSPLWLPDGKIMFASTREEFYPPWLQRFLANERRPETQLYIANVDGTGAQNVSPHEVSTAMHPFLLRSGRVAYGSQWLSHNLAYGSTNGGVNWPGTIDNMWVVMSTDHTGGDMRALLGAHKASFTAADGRRKNFKALHFLGQRANGDVCVSNYYRGNNLGLGDVYCWPEQAPGIEGVLPRFLPAGIYNVANWSKSNDEPSRKVGDIYQGKIGYPDGMSDGQLLLTVGRGYCTQVSGSISSFQRAVAEQPGGRACDVGIYRTTRIPSLTMDDMLPVVDDPGWHEFAARVIVPREIERTAPASITGDGSCELVSTNAKDAETAAHRDYKFNENYFTAAQNGSEMQGLPHSDLHGIRFWEVVPNRDRQRTFYNATGNRLAWLGDVALLDDGSFKVALPCDTPFIMAGLDRDGHVIKRDQVPQSLRQGERRVCTGCHLHSKPGRSYAESRASVSRAVPLLDALPVPDFETDIAPIFERRCQACHVADLPLLEHESLVHDPFQEAVQEQRRLVLRESSTTRKKFGLQRPYTSKYVNNMYARESLLYWKIMNRRMDGRSDDTYPDDIDFGADHPVETTAAERSIIARWLDSGTTRLIPKDP